MLTENYAYSSTAEAAARGHAAADMLLLYIYEIYHSCTMHYSRSYYRKCIIVRVVATHRLHVVPRTINTPLPQPYYASTTIGYT